MGNKGNGKQNKEMPFNSPIRVTKRKRKDGVASADNPHFGELSVFASFVADNLIVCVDVCHGHALVAWHHHAQQSTLWGNLHTCTVGHGLEGSLELSTE